MRLKACLFFRCGDESLSFGAVWHEHARISGQQIINKRIPFNSLYLGREFDNEIIKKELNISLKENNYKVTKLKNIEEEVAKLLSKNNIVARFSGRMEWG